MNDEELIELVDTAEEWSGKPFTTATEIADRVDMTRQGVHQRLEKLVDSGELNKYIAGQSAIYWTEFSYKKQPIEP